MHCENSGAELMVDTDACLNCGHPVRVSADFPKVQNTTFRGLKDIRAKGKFGFSPTVESADELVLTRPGHADIRFMLKKIWSSQRLSMPGSFLAAGWLENTSRNSMSKH